MPVDLDALDGAQRTQHALQSDTAVAMAQQWWRSRTRSVLSAFCASALRANSTKPNPSDSCRAGRTQEAARQVSTTAWCRKKQPRWLPGRLGRVGWPCVQSRRCGPARPTVCACVRPSRPISPSACRNVPICWVCAYLKRGAHSVLGRRKGQVLHEQNASRRGGPCRRGRSSSSSSSRSSGGCLGLGRLGLDGLGLGGGGGSGRGRERSGLCPLRGRPAEGAHRRPLQVQRQVLCEEGGHTGVGET